MNNKLIVIEGTDASGKQTQSELLWQRLNDDGVALYKAGFPMYDTPTGKVIAGPYLGKPDYGNSYFTEGATKVDPKVAGLYFTADRYYNKGKLQDMLSKGHIILDRYVDSNMAHQAGKLLDKEQRYSTYEWFDTLEYGLMKLPKPDIRVLLYMPRKYAKILKDNRQEQQDEHEKDEKYLQASERAYLEIAELKKYHIINCVDDDRIKTIQEINDELYSYIKQQL